MTDKHTPAATMPAHIVLDKWADIGFFWQGSVHLSTLPRLSAGLKMTDDTLPLQASVRLAKDDGILRLSYDVTGTLPLTCQRCLSPLLYDVTGRYHTALLTDERQLPAVGDDDYVFITELGMDNRLPIVDLLEDELLLTLPLSVHHDDCQMLTDSVGDVPDDEPRQNPFAILKALKDKN